MPTAARGARRLILLARHPLRPRREWDSIDPDSAERTRVDAVLALEAGPERSVAATKTYLNSLGAIALVFAAVDGEDAQAELARMPERLAEQPQLAALGAEAHDLARAGLGRVDGARRVEHRELRARLVLELAQAVAAGDDQERDQRHHQRAYDQKIYPRRRRLDTQNPV